MIIKLENNYSYSRENKNYNQDIEPFITEIMETASTGRINYQISDVENFKQGRRHNYLSHVQNHKEYLNPQEDEYYTKNYLRYKGLGPLEFSLASFLLNRHIKYDVFILTGALGSGKTCLCNYTLDFIRNSVVEPSNPLYFPTDGIIHKINFNELDDEKKEEVAVEFKLILINKLISLIETIHKKDLFIDSFIKKILSGEDDKYSLFSEFVRTVNQQRLVIEESKFDFLLNWLSKFDHSLSYKLRLISYILGFIKDNKGNKNKVDFIILFDNIDVLSDEAQIEILNIIFSFSVKLKVKILVPMRLTTFGKIKGNGSYSFGILQNTGHPPASILIKRIKHYLSNSEEYKMETKVSNEYIHHLNEKFQYVTNWLEDESTLNRLGPFFTAIAGNSIRRGLFLGERFFINHVVRFDENELHQADFARALLISDTEVGRPINEDRVVNNLFASNDGANTLLKIRILQILEYFREKKSICRINTLLSQIGLFEEYTNEEILNAINDLIFYPRRLIYIEGVKKYSDFNNLYQSMNDIVHITYSGDEYINTLVYDIVYLQNIFVPLNWKIPRSMKSLDYLRSYIEKIHAQHKLTYFNYLINLLNARNSTITDFIAPVYDYRELKERMKLLRDCLNFLMLNDLNQIAIYLENNNTNNPDYLEDRFINSSIIIDIFSKTSISVLGILKKSKSNEPELRNWYDSMIIADLWHTAIFKFKNKTLESAIDSFKHELS